MEVWMSTTKRRRVGFLIGLALGLAYACAAEFINVWMLPGISLFELPVGRLATVIATTLSMGCLGLIVAWERDSFLGVIGGAFFIVVTSSYLAYINSGSPHAIRTFILFVFTFLPRLVFYIPITLFVLWILRQFEQVTMDAAGSRRPILLALGAILVTVVAGGAFYLFPTEARQALQDTHQLTLKGVAAAAQKTDLPAPLLPVEGFSMYANGPYTLEWSDDVNAVTIPRPAAGSSAVESLIIVRFENGYEFGCVYAASSHVPQCINITPVQ
jgi:hypothetical protein